MAKAEVQKTIELLAKKGVKVTEIEVQTEDTEDKIAALDEKLEELPDIKLDLIIQYRKEKEEKLKLNQKIDNVKERLDENRTLFCLSPKKENYAEYPLDKLIHKTMVNVDFESNEVKRRR